MTQQTRPKPEPDYRCRPFCACREIYLSNSHNNMALLITRLLFITALLISGVGIAGEIYKWTDENGVVHFGDTPHATVVYSVLEIEINSYSAPVFIDVNAIENRQVVMYGTSSCGYCKKAKNYFAKKGIPFKEYHIEKFTTARFKYDQLGGKGVPLIIFGNQRLSGFSAEGFERIYK